MNNSQESNIKGSGNIIEDYFTLLGQGTGKGRFLKAKEDEKEEIKKNFQYRPDGSSREDRVF